MGGVFEDAVEDDAVKVGQGDASTRHHTLGDGQEALYGDIREAAVGAAFQETGDEYPGETGSMNVYADAYYRSGVETYVFA